MSMESNELLLTIASAATKSLSTVLAHEQPKDTSTSQKPQLKTKKDFNHKKTDSKITRNLNLKNETQIPTVPHTIEKSPDVSPIRSEVCMTNAEKKQKKSNRPILNKKFDSIFNEKILPVLLKSTKLKPKEVLPENHRKMETKKPENLINRLKAKKK